MQTAIHDVHPAIAKFRALPGSHRWTRFTSAIWIILLSMCGNGCARSADFDISVKNATALPLTIGTVKYGAPLEPAWASPEDLAIGSPNRPGARWGAVVRPGEVATVHVAGKFAGGASAFLRAYLGDLSLSELLATGRRNAARIDLPLYRGPNAFVISLRDGKLDGARQQR